MNSSFAQKQMTENPRSLRWRAAEAGLWKMGEFGFGYLLRLASNLIMSRLLYPEAFGLMAMVMTVITGMELFTDIGIRQSVIRSPRGDTPHFLRAAWTIQLFRRAIVVAAMVVAIGALLWLFGPTLAPPGTVYANGELPFLIMASALIVIVNGLESTNAWLAARRIQYRRVTIMGVISQIVGLAVMLGFAAVHASAWTLLLGAVAGAVTNTILSHTMLPGPRMGFVRDKEIDRELWRFGKWIIVSSVFFFASTSADSLVLAGLLQGETFGHYVIAAVWIGAIRSVISRASDSVVYPMLGEISRERPADLKEMLRKVSLATDAVTIVAFAAAVLLIPAVIRLIYTTEYAGSAVIAQVLAVSVLNMHFVSISKFLLLHGDSKSMAISSAIGAVLLFAGVPLGYHLFGLAGALVVVVVAPSIASMVYVWRARSAYGLPIAAHLIWPVLTLGLSVALSWSSL